MSIFHGARDDWEPGGRPDHRVGSVIAAGLALVALGLLLAGCASPPAVHPARTGEMPIGTGPLQYEAGFSAFCRSNPGESTCPPR